MARKFELAEEILDQVARFIEFRIEVGRRPAVVSGRDDGRFTGRSQGSADALIGIEGLIRDQPIGRPRQQSIGTNQIVRLSRRQYKTKANGLPRASTKAWIFVLSPPGCGRRLERHLFGGTGAVLLGANNGAIDRCRRRPPATQRFVAIRRSWPSD